MNIAGWSNGEVIIFLILLLLLVVFAACTVLVKDLLKSAIALAATSAIVSIVMFMIKSYLAAVFELSVCAGLITALFISTISLTKQRTEQEQAEYSKDRSRRFRFLPLVLLVVGLVLFALRSYINLDFAVKSSGPEPAVQEVLWNTRKTDILGQIVIILAGVFGVAILFKERDQK